MTEPDFPFRLETAYLPTDCDLNLIPDIPAKTFTGTEVLTFSKTSDSPYADLFADPTLSISSIQQSNLPLTFKHTGNRLRIFGPSLDHSPVTITFTGSLDQKSSGWYWMTDTCCSTFFEATHARQAFPCFDEPSQKTTFRITLTVPKPLTAISNMPVESLTTTATHTTFSFQRSPPICVYLVAFAVGDFDVLNGFTARGLPVDIFALPGHSDLLSFALREAISALEWYEQFFDFPYALPRLQLLAVPEFIPGGMENFGLIIFREDCLLADPATDSVWQVRIVAQMIAHEIAHQWCGDAVSPKFWDSLWLNEGFATFLPYLCFSETHPDWESWNEFQVLEYSTALLADDLVSAHPIQQTVAKDGEIEGLFDGISYSKAGCLVRMLLTKLGVAQFRAGMRAFFAEFLHKNADTADLCGSLSRTIGVDLEPFFTAWTTRNNYPIVVLEDDGTLSQRHFTRNAILDDRWWPLPIVIASGKGGVVAEQVLELGEAPVRLSLDCDWLKVNRDCRSFCRVWQQGRYFTALLSAVRERQVGSADRWAVIVDYRALAQVGLVSSADVFALLRTYEDEADPLVGGEIVATLRAYAQLFGDSAAKIGALAKTILARMLAKIGREAQPGESGNVKTLRSQLITGLVWVARDAETIEYAKGLWVAWLADKASIDANLVRIAFRVAARYADAFDRLVAIAKNDSSPEVKSLAAIALGFSPLERADEVLRIALAAPLQDVPTYMAGVAFNTETGRRMWDFVRENWAKINELFGTSAFNIPSLIEWGTAPLKTEEEAVETEQWFAQHPSDVATQAIRDAVEKIRNRATLIARDRQKVADFFAALE